MGNDIASAFAAGAGVSAGNMRGLFLVTAAILLGCWAVWVVWGLMQQFDKGLMKGGEVMREIITLCTVVAILTAILWYGQYGH